MTHAVQALIDTFDHLPEPERRQAASAILRRVRGLDLGSVSEEDLIEAADHLFLELDSREAADEQPRTR